MPTFEAGTPLLRSVSFSKVERRRRVFAGRFLLPQIPPPIIRNECSPPVGVQLERVEKMNCEALVCLCEVKQAKRVYLFAVAELIHVTKIPKWQSRRNEAGKERITPANFPGANNVFGLLYNVEALCALNPQLRRNFRKSRRAIRLHKPTGFRVE